MQDPWAFGWTQLLTIVGLCITIGIAASGFYTFGRWKREKIEERRIETALDALAFAYESKDVFRYIRGAMSSAHDWEDMPTSPGETQAMRQLRGSYYVVFKRMVQHNDFFARAWKLQPRVMAVFGESAEEIFQRLHNARATIQVASTTLSWDMPLEPASETAENRELRIQLRDDLWGTARTGKDRVKEDLEAFRTGIIHLCKPVVDREFKPNVSKARRAD
jgi:hypothetical protein